MTRFALRKPFIAFALALSLLAGFASLDAAPAHAAKMIEELENRSDWQKLVVSQSQDRPVIVVFEAKNCKACSNLSRDLNQLIRQERGRIALVRVDQNRYRDLSNRHSVRGLPDLRAYINGREVRNLADTRMPRGMEAMIDDLIRRYRQINGHLPRRW